VFPNLTVRQNLDLALVAAPDRGLAEERLERVHEFFPVLRDRLDQVAGTLSGGEQQMVGLAQAFLWRPRLLMIDELSLGLSPIVVGQLLETVRAINRDGATVVLVEQSVNVALTVAERAVFMEKGEVRFDGRTSELLARPDIMRAIYVKGTTALAAPRQRPAPDAVAPAGRALLDVRGVRLSFGGVTALDGVDLTVAEGEVLGVIGPNGAGKTTLFDVVSGYLSPDSGEVWFDGVDVSRLTSAQRGQRGLVRRFQDAKLFASLSVREAIRLALDRQLEVRNIFLSALPLSAVRKGEARVRARARRSSRCSTSVITATASYPSCRPDCAASWTWLA
jgi:branched-chain amino acid transport system ATP-binding protein